MQKVTRIEDFPAAVAAARRIAASAFSSDRLFVERYVENARHVEVQVLGDRHGTVVHCFERECSLQRRHQKVIEESPCSILSAEERSRIAESGRAFAAQVGYQGAGTVEFLFDPVSREHYFLEMNTRLQVEHPVTEVVLGLDLVVAQLRIARGERLQDILGEPLVQRGHGIEVRVYAEDPAAGYVPQVGTLLRADWPDVPFVRVDAGFAAGDSVPMHYDPMLAKIISWGRTRNEAADRLLAALRETTVHGVVTNIPFLMALLQEPAFRNAEIDTGWLDRTWGNTAPGQSAAVSDTAMLVLGALVAAPLPTGKGTTSTQPAQETSEPWNQLQGWRLGA